MLLRACYARVVTDEGLELLTEITNVETIADRAPKASGDLVSKPIAASLSAISSPIVDLP
jgi:hypothetical protein